MQHNRLWFMDIMLLGMIGVFLVAQASFFAVHSAAAATTSTVVLGVPRGSCMNGKPRVTLLWRKRGNAASFTVQRRSAARGTWVTVSPVVRQGTRFVDRALPPAQGTYQYRVAAMAGRTRITSAIVKVSIPRCGGVLSSSSSVRSSSVRPQLGKTWGAFVGWEPSQGAAFEARIGQPMGIRAAFVHWGNENEFPAELANAAQGKTLLIFWEAMDYNDDAVEQSRFSYKAILRGDWDAYFTSFAAQAKDYGGPVILVPFEEMNGDWYPWSGTANGNTPAEHIAAYRYIREFFRSAPNVKFGWAANSDSVPDTVANGIDAYYPGDAYVDYVGVDGFNFGDPWMTFDQIFGPALDQLKTYGKPVYIFSMASADGPGKAAWITDALGTQMARHPEVAGWVWFHEDKEHDWRVWSDEASLKAFQKGIQ